MFLQIFALLLCALPPSTSGFTTSRSTNGSTSRSTNGSTGGSTTWSGGSPTYQRTDPESGVTHTCDRCAPGTFLKSPCTDTRKSVCDACPPGSFTELWNYIEACITCGACTDNQEAETRCSASRDTACRCVAGHYYVPEYEMCIRHSTCPASSGVVAEGTAQADTRCQPCEEGWFSGRVSALDACSAHTDCSAGGRRPLLAGVAWHDSLCTSCQELRGSEALEYLRAILPGFLFQHNLRFSQLRGLLPGPLSPGRALGREELQNLLVSWVLQAPVQELRKLLQKMRRGRTSRKIQHKLNRIRRAMEVLNAQCGEEEEERRREEVLNTLWGEEEEE